jgi:hypothetical protein
MFSLLRNRFGIPGVISVIALVFAMLGGAYAANNSDGGKASASAKAKKGPRGPKGATGPAGPQGPAGANGKDGAAGANGKDGTNGANGTSVTTASFSGVGHGCQEGGVVVKSAGPEVGVCNGAEGEEGSPWTAGGTLPEGATETGGWSMTLNGSGIGATAISFPVPMAEEKGPANVKVIGIAEAAPAECEDDEHEGTASVGNPEATPGFLCVYSGTPNTVLFPGEGGFAPTSAFRLENGSFGYSRSGAVIGKLGVPANAGAYGQGSWAIAG